MWKLLEVVVYNIAHKLLHNDCTKVSQSCWVVTMGITEPLLLPSHPQQLQQWVQLRFNVCFVFTQSQNSRANSSGISIILYCHTSVGVWGSAVPPSALRESFNDWKKKKKIAHPHWFVRYSDSSKYGCRMATKIVSNGKIIFFLFKWVEIHMPYPICMLCYVGKPTISKIFV